MIKGERVYLMPVTDLSMMLIAKWHEDEWFDDVMSGERGPKSVIDLKNMYQQFMPPYGRLFMGCIRPSEIMEAKDIAKLSDTQKVSSNELVQVGVVALANIDWKNRKAEIYGGIGETGLREKGLGIDAMRTIIHWARLELGLHRIYAYVKEHNQIAINSLKTAGFTLECMMKDAAYQDGKFINKALLAATPREMKDKQGNVYYGN